MAKIKNMISANLKSDEWTSYKSSRVYLFSFFINVTMKDLLKST